jgi:hypothetical protein
MMCTAVGPATSRNYENVVKVHKIMTTVQTANETGISYTMDQSILTEHMSMQHLRAKFVPTVLVEDQMDIRNSLNDQHKKQISCQILLLGTNPGSLPWSLR